MESVYGLREISHDLAMELNPTGLARKLVSVLPRMGMSTALVSLLVPDEPGQLQVLLGSDDGTSLPLDVAYPATQLLPAGFPAGGPPRVLIALPLTFGRKVLGLVVFGGEADPFVCEAVRNQLGAALELAALHARVVEETALRERLARDQLLGELAVARRIQTALIPREPCVPSLEVVACMAPADQVGGDYYDIINAEDGCWFAIGDVTGHGLLAGMIMLMMQSAVTGIIYSLPNGTPSQIIAQLNRVIHSNVRERLNESEHATFIVLRYRSNGTVTLAGAHDDLIVYRADRARCERHASTGIWLGITDNVTDCTQDDTFSLGVGDILLLYTDGLTEARSASGEMFGIDRVEALLSAHAAAPALEIQERLRSALRAWAPVQQDDVTLIVARRRA
jgi:serine phosphatase RsbU (regulator of sigma subunit)